MSHANQSSAAQKMHVLLCFDSVIERLLNAPHAPAIKHSFNGAKFPLFVTWKKRANNGHKDDWRLRGCIGTFSAKELAAGQASKYTHTSLAPHSSRLLDL
jgi:AMMECR1 domain-containing protein